MVLHLFVFLGSCIWFSQQNIAYFHNQRKDYKVFAILSFLYRVLKGSNWTELMPFIEFLRDRRLKKHVF